MLTVLNRTTNDIYTQKSKMKNTLPINENTHCKSCILKSTASGTLNDIELNEMGNNCTEMQFATGDNIIEEGSKNIHVAYIKSGLVKIHVDGSVRKIIMKIVKAPAYLCLPGAFGDKVNNFSVTAIESTTVCLINLATFKNFILYNGDFAYQIILDISKSELLNLHTLINNTQKENPGRIASVILFFFEYIYNNASFILPLSRQDLADLTGITRESASRILSAFVKQKILQIEGRKIVVLNEPGLREISEN